MENLTIIGGGLAGSEAAWQAANRGISVTIYEMRPLTETGAHISENLAELVCSNSLGSNLVERASGLLKSELRMLNSLLIQCADQTAVPAGSALAVDRTRFSDLVTEKIESHTMIRVVRKEITELPESVTIVASGPLTSPGLSSALGELTGNEHLYFYDAISPIVTSESINKNIAFHASRYDRGIMDTGDYINCPMDRNEYEQFVDALISAERVRLKAFEIDLESGVKAGIHKYFEGCLPIEIMAQRGRNTLAFGPLRPVGLTDPRTGKRPFAIVQLRQDNLAGTIYNLVGFQTNLTYSEQRRVFRMIPGLEEAEFVRLGQMHRNTYIFSPALLSPTLQFRGQENIFFAGQITGVEGYSGNIATGLIAGINTSRWIQKKPMLILPSTTMIGALCHYITHASASDFQPMKANFGLLPNIASINSEKGKRQRAMVKASRAIADLDQYVRDCGD